MTHPITVTILAILFGLMLLLVGGEDFAVAQAEHEHYISMVCDGYWPDYQNIKPECKK